MLISKSLNSQPNTLNNYSNSELSCIRLLDAGTIQSKNRQFIDSA